MSTVQDSACFASALTILPPYIHVYNEVMERPDLDPVRQETAREYARIRRRLLLADLVMGGVYALAWLLAGWSRGLRDFLGGVASNDWLIVAGFIAIFGGVYALINLPLGYYSGYILPHRFGLSTQTIWGWVTDQVKGLAIGGAIGLLVVEVIYWVLRSAPETWWLWAGAILWLFNVLLANLAPVLLMPLFFKVKPLGEEHGDLVGRLVRLAENSRTKVRGVFQFDLSRRTRAANAALTGLGNTRRIILGDTLLSEFTPDEIETVLAHELGHHVHRDIPVGILIESLLTLAGLYLAHLGLNLGIRSFGFESAGDVAAVPLFALVMGIYGLATMPLSNGYSRWRERRADEYALKATGKGAAYASALTRLANQNLADVDPEPWVEFLLHSHPALSRRIKMALAQR
jgi:STE24 endopeptidase